MTFRLSQKICANLRKSVVLLLGAICFTGCEREDRVVQATKDKILLLGNGAEPKALDPHLVQSVGDSNILRALFEGLVAYHPTDDSKHEPGVALTWEPNADYTVWTFKLNPDAKWSNGDPVTARDFVYSYNRILHPEMAGPYASMLYFLKNGQKFNEGEIDDFSQVGIEAVDDHTLVCTLEDPAPYFPDVVKHTSWLPVHKDTVEKFGNMTAQYSMWQRPGNHVSNGAFQLVDWKINAYVSVERNPHYWDAKNVKPNGIKFFAIENNFTEERAFRDGLLHMSYTMPSNLIDWYKKERPDLLRIETYAGVYFFRCNVTKPPMNNKDFRKALSLALDQETIVKYVTMGGQTPATGYVPPSDAGYQPPNRISFDPEKASEHLKKAGFSSGVDVPEFSIIINTSESHKSIAEAVQAMWKEHLGIEKVKITNQEWKVFQVTVKELKYDVARAGWIGDYVDPNTFLSMWKTNDSNNETGWSNADYDRLLKEAANLSETSDRYAKMKEAEEILLDELPILPLYWYTRVYLLSPDVINWHPLLLDNHPYKHIDLAPATTSN